MKLKLIATVVMFLGIGQIAFAHRLDEYLQASLITVEKDRVRVSMRMIPGVAVSSSVISSIDINGDGVLSEVEQRTYAERVLEEWSLTVDNKNLRSNLVSASFPEVEQMREGVGEIHLEFAADLPPVNSSRRLVFENQHPKRDKVYLVNCLIPRDPSIYVLAQKRNEQQSFYQLDYRQLSGSSNLTASASSTSSRSSGVGFVALFLLGIRHIAAGTDHLLFLLTLLLPAPLIALSSRWTESTSVRASVLRILRVVTAFTIGHSVTLALAALGFVHVPSRPVEVLIAVSILVSAIHALLPIFPGRETWIAALFGLVHGLAFASTLSGLGLGRWESVIGILAFNLGIEAMQLMVVAATMPSLLLISRTRAYPFLRISGALFAGFASVGWIAERLFRVHNSMNFVVEMVVHRAAWIGGMFFLISLCCWRVGRCDGPTTTAAPLANPL